MWSKEMHIFLRIIQCLCNNSHTNDRRENENKNQNKQTSMFDNDHQGQGCKHTLALDTIAKNTRNYVLRFCILFVLVYVFQKRQLGIFWKVQGSENIPAYHLLLNVREFSLSLAIVAFSLDFTWNFVLSPHSHAKYWHCNVQKNCNTSNACGGFVIL